MDSKDHIDYIKYIAQKWKIPKADEGLQMYQPPFYYTLAALFYSLGNVLRLEDPLKVSQLISFISSLGNILLIYLISKKFFKEKKVRILVILMAIFLPMHIYESPVISNEILLSFLSTLSLYYFLINDWHDKNFLKIIILGIMVGLACLIKYSGLTIFLSMIISFLINFLFKKNKIYLENMTIFAITVLILSGWFYLRQYLLFGNPLILANDPKLFPYLQEPGYRDLKFYLSLEGPLPLNIFGAQMKSFWGGTYNTIWIDAHHTFLPIMGNFSKAGAVIIYLALIPTAIILIGFLKQLKQAIKRQLDDKSNILLIFPILSFLSYTFYTYKLPFGSSVKAFYLLNNILPLTIFFGMGMEKVIKWLKNYQWILYLELLTLIMVIYKFYWYQSWWKNIGE